MKIKILSLIIAITAAAAGQNTNVQKSSTTNVLVGSLLFPNTGLRVQDTDASTYLRWITGSNLSAPRDFTLITGDANRTLTISADSAINQDVSTTASPTWAGATFGTLTITNLIASNFTFGASSGLLSASAGTVSVTQSPTITGLLTINETGGTLPSVPANAGLWLATNSTNRVLYYYSYGSNTAIILRRSNGTVASPTAIQNADGLFSIRAGGYGATGFDTGVGSAIIARATQNWTDSAQGSQLTFSTTPNGSTSSTVALTLDQDQSATFAGSVTAAKAITNTAPVNLGNLTGTINIDWSQGNFFYGTLTANVTFTFSNVPNSQGITVKVIQTGTNTFTVGWPAVNWTAGVAPVMTAGSATHDTTTFVSFLGDIDGSTVQNLK